MTIRTIFVRKFGSEEYRNLSPRLRELFEKVDSQTSQEKPVTRKQLAEALR